MAGKDYFVWQSNSFLFVSSTDLAVFYHQDSKRFWYINCILTREKKKLEELHLNFDCACSLEKNAQKNVSMFFITVKYFGCVFLSLQKQRRFPQIPPHLLCFSTKRRDTEPTQMSIKRHLQGQSYLRRQEFPHLRDKVRRHQLVSQQGSEGLKELTSCHSICSFSLAALSLSSVCFIVQRVSVVSYLMIKHGIKQDPTVGSSQIDSFCCQHSFFYQVEA